MIKSYFNWSGGKDSALALWRVMKEREFQVEYLLTSMNSIHDRVSMHGVRRELLQAQATCLGIPLITIELPEQPGMNEYEDAMSNKVRWLKEQGVTHAIFGDIFLEDLRRYREEKLSAAGIECVFPIWKRNTRELLHQFIAESFKAIIVCVNQEYLGKSFCGQAIDKSFCRNLPATVDPCGENGEYHTFVYDGPIFNQPLSLVKGDIVQKEYAGPKHTSAGNDQEGKSYGFYFCDLLPGKKP